MRPIQVLSIVEATSLTGPARPLLLHATYVHNHDVADVGIRQSLVTTYRGQIETPTPQNAFVQATQDAGIDLDFCAERWPFDSQVLSQLQRVIERRRPDIIESHGYKASFMLWALRLKARSLPSFGWVAYHHGYTATSLRIQLYQELDRLTLRHADRLVTFNPAFASAVERRGVKRSNITILQNPVPEFPSPTAEELAELRRMHGITPNTLVVLSVGRLSREKAQDNLIKAFASASRDRAPSATRLLIVGDGPERPALMSLANATEAPITFVGHVDRVHPYYALADVFTLTSHSEGSPMALLEAMSAGLPAVATAVGGVPEITDDGAAAMLVKPRDVPALADALTALMNDAPKRKSLGALARERAKRFGIDGYAARLRGVYEQIVPAQR